MLLVVQWWFGAPWGSHTFDVSLRRYVAQFNAAKGTARGALFQRLKPVLREVRAASE